MGEESPFLRELRRQQEGFRRDEAKMFSEMDAYMRARGSTDEPSPGPCDETRSESGGGTHAYCDCSSCRLRRAEDAEAEVRRLRDLIHADAGEANITRLCFQMSNGWAEATARVRVLEAQLGALQTLAESRGDEAMLIILRAGR